jgi:cell division transport system permease protein
MERIKAGIARDPYVTGVYYQENLVDEVGGNVNRAGWISLVAALFFVIVAVTLIHNTIRLSLYANRFIIRNMELVGASWEFISRPYLIRALRHGLLSAAIAIGILILLLSWAQNRFPELKQIEDLTGFILLFAGLILTGILINMASTYYVVRKYLRMREDDLY